jgi:hypothetical protein
MHLAPDASLPQGDGSGSFSHGHEDEKYSEWCNDFPRYIIPRICAYYQLYPERFKRTGHGEEIEIAGFDTFVKNDDYFKSGRRSSAWSGKVKDPWGEPVHFVEDLNMDGTSKPAASANKCGKKVSLAKSILPIRSTALAS